MKISPEKYARYLAPISVILGILALYYFLPSEWTNIRKFGIILGLLFLSYGNVFFFFDISLSLVNLVREHFKRTKEQTNLISGLTNLSGKIIDRQGDTINLVEKLIRLISSGIMNDLEFSTINEKEFLEKAQNDLAPLNVAIAKLESTLPHLATKAELSDKLNNAFWETTKRYGAIIGIFIGLFAFLKLLKIIP